MTFLMQGVAGVRGFARDGCCSCALSLATPCRQMHVFAKRKKNPPRERKKVPARHHTSYVSRPRLNRTVARVVVGAAPLPGGVLSPSWIGSAAGCARRLHREAGADFLVVHAMGAVSSTQLRSPAPVPTARLRRRSFVKSQYQQQQTPLGEQQGGRSSPLSATPKRKGAETPPTSPARARDGVLAVQRISFTDTPLLGGVESSPSGRQVQRVNSIRADHGKRPTTCSILTSIRPSSFHLSQSRTTAMAPRRRRARSRRRSSRARRPITDLAADYLRLALVLFGRRHGA